MTLHNTKDMRLVLSSDAKPRLRWTQELHQIFVDAVAQLGGPEKARPKSLMRVMGIHGLTLYHLKSHLQKYRFGRSQESQTYQQNTQEDDGENQTSKSKYNISIGTHEDNNEDSQIAQALQMQMDVQKKLHERIEVQKHLHLRIEAQRKYLQSVLKKAQETLSDYRSCSSEVEQVKAQLSHLVSMVDSRCLSSSSSFSVLTESCNNSMLRNSREKVMVGHDGYSVESSLMSSESSGSKKEEIQTIHNKRKTNPNPVVLSLMEMRPAKNDIESDGRKRSKNSDESMNIDLNCDLMSEFDSGTKGVVDLNCN